MEILVTGGTGFLGQHLARQLMADGHQVCVMGRDFRQANDLIHAGAAPICVDLRDRPAVAAACAGIDVVCHVGAKSEPWGKPADFFSINVGGTEAVLDGCRQHGVRRLIYISSPAVMFDGRDQHNLTEAAPYPKRFTSWYALTKKLGEDRVNAAASTGLETVILRPKAIFGPGDRSLLPRLLNSARERRLPRIGTGRNLVDLTYVDNVVRAIVLALEARSATGKTYLITNGEHVPLWDMITSVLERLDLPTALRNVPLPVAMMAARAMELRARVTGTEPLLTTYSAAILARTQTYDISAARRDLGYAPPVSVAQGVERTIQALLSDPAAASSARRAGETHGA